MSDVEKARVELMKWWLKSEAMRDLSVMTILSKTMEVGRLAEDCLFSMVFTVFQNFLASEPQEENFSLK